MKMVVLTQRFCATTCEASSSPTFLGGHLFFLQKEDSVLAEPQRRYFAYAALSVFQGVSSERSPLCRSMELFLLDDNVS